MKIKLISFSFFFLFLVSHIFADQVPIILLKSSVQDVLLTVMNNWDRDLSVLTFSVDHNSLPDWLSIDVNNQVGNVTSGERGSEQFHLTFRLCGAPASPFVEIPYTLTDSMGNRWRFSVKVSTCTSSGPGVPLVNTLHDNYPNPFNPITTIRYSLVEDCFATLVIYNTLGQEVRTLVKGIRKASFHTVQWDGCNNDGRKVSSGLYFYRLQAGSFVQTRRMMLIE